MISVPQDFTEIYNRVKTLNLDVSGYDFVIVQIESGSGAINFNTTLDSGAITGITDGGPAQSTAYQPVQGTNLATGTGAVASAAGSTIWKFSYIGRYLQLTSASSTVSRLLVSFNKID